MSEAHGNGLDLDARRRRIRYRAGHRGLRELDLLMGGFAAARIDTLEASDVDEFERLLDIPDQILLSWFMGEAPPDPARDTPLWRAMRAFGG